MEQVLAPTRKIDPLSTKEQDETNPFSIMELGGTGLPIQIISHGNLFMKKLPSLSTKEGDGVAD